ncbi:MAG: chemotaxis protein CheA [Deltaproteobacteria bacterium]
MLDDQPAWHRGRIQAVAGVLINCCAATGDVTARDAIEAALAQALASGDCAPMVAWLDARSGAASLLAPALPATNVLQAPPPPPPPPALAGEGAPKFGRRAGDQVSSNQLKVDKVKIDRLMNLIGEMVVSKNALPYLAQRAETQFGVRELGREIAAQYAVINRIAEEMQDAIMQVRMMPVSMVFQRFPRLVRDISHKLGKEVQLVLEGEDTEADKNIIESLADPLIHIVRNSLDHGLEPPEVRRACGKPAVGVLTIRASQDADRVRIEVIDDGRGIDVATIKRKAYERGLIDEATLERITDREALNLVFAAGLSTATVVSDLSGRGVGMDVVRTAVEHVNGNILLESEVGRGTHISITVPLSMAVTPVMIVESDGQVFGVPMDHVLETVRVPRAAVRTIKHSQTTVLRGRIVPLTALNSWLNIPAEPLTNADDELAVLMVRVRGEVLGLVLDDFREAIDVIQKPLGGVLAGLAAYSGSALLGDGSVLMVLDPKEIR